MSPRRPPPKKRPRDHVVIPGDPADPEGFHRSASDFFEWLQVHDYAPSTVLGRSWFLAAFIDWCEVRAITRPSQVTLPVLEAYQRHVSLMKKRDGRPLAFATQSRYIVAVRVFFSFLARTRRIGANPAADLTMPRRRYKLPKATLTHEEAEAVLALPDTATVLGLRDRVMLEVFYATAMRRVELAKLMLGDVDLARRFLTLRDTKNRSDRVVPTGERAAAWLARYLADARPQLCVKEDPGCVFLAANGERLSLKWISAQVHRYVDAAAIGKSGSCHLFRHTAATLMVSNGADIRFVQELLGHRDLGSTQLYTRVAPDKLAAIHAATHPGARLDGAEKPRPPP